MSDTAVRIDGLAQFRRNLKKLDNELPKALRLALNESAETVAGTARRRVPSGSGRAEKSVRVASTQSKARVKGGGAKAPYYPWLDFGGRVGRNRSISRRVLKEGRYIYRAYFDKRDSGEFVEVLKRALLKVAKQAGVEVD